MCMKGTHNEKQNKNKIGSSPRYAYEELLPIIFYSWSWISVNFVISLEDYALISIKGT